MDLVICRTNWGMTGPFEAQLDAIAAHGYDGAELNMTARYVDPKLLLPMLAARGLLVNVIGQCPSFDILERLTQTAQALGAKHLVSHSGMDRMSFDEGCRFFEAALALEQRTGVAIAHETHRVRLLYAPWTTTRYLHTFPELRICADLSHWVVVAGRWLDDCAEDMSLAINRCDYLHARVGHTEAPQVSDPRAPEWAVAVNRHMDWYKRIAAAHRARGESVLRATCEFGPPHYQQTLPFTGVPVANVDAINDWMKNRLREELRYL